MATPSDMVAFLLSFVVLFLMFAFALQFISELTEKTAIAQATMLSTVMATVDQDRAKERSGANEQFYQKSHISTQISKA